ncbi:gamma-glutamyl-gamma-aminobutyrate hydrolase family protein [Glutamicibacter protophormiae]|uniref:gamma-glutamyl-gamma-aminobutyrate hydrolase family protein n=1 Tax=Glutamicibacter protophormiae TaxID=37930 RepID=UPI002A82B9D7|nr:gamma-glutamyl-gamma-aminobutyrate hydrolase family protein [Glutamicibacter protophormiae]WPR64453.1 gamma-glutamyl-gamma-aminobutyrate hydrolase family protein [Glutamicibacter protophormiae]WPR67947.1 gamma-glutamyl-gamma-aminobutyrate hydrolase family protein [Glutamicibacter protophormiae]
MSRHPRIGVPGMWSNSVHGLRYDGLAVATGVLQAIVDAGGEPVPLFPHSPMELDERLEILDGIVVPGGADVNPNRYGAQHDERTGITDHPGQDDADARIIRACLERDLPTLLICRGMQLLNVELGGTLHAHLPTEPLDHVGSIHRVIAAEGSALRGAWGAAEQDVSSYHHQAVDRVGDGLVVTGRSEDGTIEALEVPGRRILAVQWHPEDRAAHHAGDRAMFDWIVAEARAEVPVG